MIAGMNGLPNVSTANAESRAQDDAAVSRSVALVPRAAHTPLEDVQGILTGCLFVALSLWLSCATADCCRVASPGCRFCCTMARGWSLGAVLFALNLPFYVFAWRALGATFTLKTFCAVAVLAVYHRSAARICFRSPA